MSKVEREIAEATGILEAKGLRLHGSIAFRETDWLAFKEYVAWRLNTRGKEIIEKTRPKEE